MRNKTKESKRDNTMMIYLPAKIFRVSAGIWACEPKFCGVFLNHELKFLQQTKHKAYRVYLRRSKCIQKHG